MPLPVRDDPGVRGRDAAPGDRVPDPPRPPGRAELLAGEAGFFGAPPLAPLGAVQPMEGVPPPDDLPLLEALPPTDDPPSAEDFPPPGDFPAPDGFLAAAVPDPGDGPLVPEDDVPPEEDLRGLEPAPFGEGFLAADSREL
ncbi:hypothetical protein EBN88_10955 [Streptomyces triticirhizae]|uniref:Uncharacterized protein n=2 Tax=Streptomyces triticirhizae TaxID=2483353 RepID=A0A3M2LZF3_9ACTN|nr:hypothetical protein EBN88_10955 [Streptomyces triticirhizae]